MKAIWSSGWMGLALISWLGMGRCGAATIHVRVDGTDAASGATWTEAVDQVTRALERAASGDEIWVAAGSYTNALTLKAGVALYGGFRGTETQRADRDRLANETILDGGGTNIVVRVESGGPDTVLDGFTIQHGAGCGVRVSNSAATIARNRIRWCQSSAALAYGAGISVKNVGSQAVATLEENVIVENYAFDGGGVACIDASPRITGNTIAWNTAAQNGGGISCWRDASPLIENNTIYGNSASWVPDSGAVPLGGGGVFATADDLDGRPHPTARSAPRIRNNVIAANGAANGGGIALVDANGGVPIVVNNTVVANSGSGILWGSSALVPIAPVLINNLVAFNPWGLEQLQGTPTNAVIEHNCVFGNRVHTRGANYRGLPDRTGSDGNLSLDPRLASVRFGNLHLQAESPCRDAGRDGVGALGALDIDGEPRQQGAAVDIGADESDGRFWTVAPRVIRVAATGEDGADGSSWTRAKRTVAAALDAIRPTGGEVWVAAGNHSGHIWLPAFVHLHGGFSGTETRLEERRPAEMPTILDGGGRPNVVMSGQGGFGVSTLEGFTVTGGGRYTGGTNLNKYGLGGKGGGILISVSSPVITNNVITRNSLAYDSTTNQAPSYGAGIACQSSYAVIGGNTIEENEILNDFDGSGAGIYCLNSMPWIVNNRIARNQAAYGAAIYTWGSTPLIVGNTIESNGMYVLMPLFRGAVEGAITLHLADDALVEGNRILHNTAGVGAGLNFNAFRAGRVQNNLFLGNHAYDPTAAGGMGGGLYLLVTTNATSPIRVVHNTLVGNVASNLFEPLGGGLAFTLVPPATNLVIANNLVVSNSSGLYQTLTVPRPKPHLLHNNVISLGPDYVGLDPGPTDVRRPVVFVDPPSGNYQLAAGSADIDDGDVGETIGFDLAGVARPLDGDADGEAAPDLGAWEFVHPTADTDGEGLPDTWEVAMGLDPLTPDAGMDADGDGASNGQEYLAGTHPRDPGSVLALHVDRIAGHGVRLSWMGMNGREYVVDRGTRLAESADWTPHQTVSGDGSEVTVEVAVQPGVAGFFRLRLVGP